MDDSSTTLGDIFTAVAIVAILGMLVSDKGDFSPVKFIQAVGDGLEMSMKLALDSGTTPMVKPSPNAANDPGTVQTKPYKASPLGPFGPKFTLPGQVPSDAPPPPNIFDVLPGFGPILGSSTPWLGHKLGGLASRLWDKL
ncbi:MAG: hypothetical protein JSR64_17060 [Nitrospira sp.]|nr:hypothetical protein [Nitrospira sp.]